MKKHVLALLLFLMSIVLLTASSAGTLQELREDPENFWANPDQKYEKVISRIEKVSHSNSYRGTVLIAKDDEIILFGGTYRSSVSGS